MKGRLPKDISVDILLSRERFCQIWSGFSKVDMARSHGNLKTIFVHMFFLQCVPSPTSVIEAGSVPNLGFGFLNFGFLLDILSSGHWF
jgi:hypothetical protein